MLPSLKQWPDLTESSAIRRAWTVANPLLALAAYAFFSGRRDWVAAVSCVVWFSFVSYGSTSHDLLHRALGLPLFWNRFFFHLIERLALRSGHAYELAHLNHHRVFPSPDDVEGRLIYLSWWRVLLVAPLQVFRVWAWAWKQPNHRAIPLALDAVWFMVFVTASFVLWPVAPQLGVYAALVMAGAWAIPFVTVLLPHRAFGSDAFTHTRWFRGKFSAVVFFEHLYHLEHHLYPSVPHHRWKALSDRLEPHLRSQGLTPIVLPALR